MDSRECVERGAMVLDSVKPDWFDAVDQEELLRCTGSWGKSPGIYVLGSVFPQKGEASRMIGSVIGGFTVSKLMYHGFLVYDLEYLIYLAWDCVHSATDKEYARDAHLWAAEVQARISSQPTTKE